MNANLRKDADYIINKAINKVKPDEAVKRAFKNRTFDGNVYIVAAGKAAFQMAQVASELIDYKKGIVVTKYGHVLGTINKFECFEAGHPIPDENSFIATEAVLEMTKDLTEKDTVIFLLSGGGSALFESSAISLFELQTITEKLLKSGADINEINTIRKRLSKVKGGRFAEHLFPAKVFSVILSDIIGDPIDMIASGPTVPDSKTSIDAKNIVNKYNIPLSEDAKRYIDIETPKTITNAENIVIGSVRELCLAARKAAEDLGYEVTFLTDTLCSEAKEAGVMLGCIAKSHKDSIAKKAFVLGGETVVHVRGNGIGGRNQEIAVAAAPFIAGIKNVAVFSVGSDGTDGPCDAAGGYVDGDTYDDVILLGMDFLSMQENNDCYHILKAVNNLVITGPTGTNVNDFSMVLIN